MVLRLCLALILLAGLHPACLASKADELLEQAQKKVAAARKAEAAKNSTDRDENYTEAIKILGKVEGESKYMGTPQGAEAAYRVALINEALANAYDKNEKKQRGYLMAMYEKLKQLLNIYDKPQSVLEEALTPDEAAKVRTIVANAAELKLKTAERIDYLNSSDIKYKILDFFVALTGRIPWFSYWFAIILITFIVKLLITPLTHAQFRSMKEMQKVGPLIKEIQAKHKGDQKTIGEKTMALYKEHHINPFASCLPLIVQMPVLIGLFYTMKSYEFQFAKGTFLWIGSGLSHMTSFPVPFSVGQLVWFTARNLAEPDLIMLILYLISMYLSTKISAVDPTQAEQQKMMSIVMPLMFAFILAGFPSAFLLYWLVFNILQTGQQYMILKGGRAEVITPPPTPPTPEPTEEGAATDSGTRIQRRKRKK